MPFPYDVAAGQPLTAALILQMAPTNVAASLRRYNGQSIATGTDTLVTWHDEYEDGSNGHDNTTNPGRWYAPAAGRYKISCLLTWQSSAGGGRRTMWIRVNNGAEYNLDSRHSSANALIQNSGERTLRLAAGDYIEIWCHQASGGAINIDGAARDGCSCDIDYVGP